MCRAHLKLRLRSFRFFDMELSMLRSNLRRMW